jgi:pyridoxamine 5'-phosphate oxidase
MPANDAGTNRGRTDTLSAAALATLRRDYAHAVLTEQDVDPDPIRQFERWFADAQAAEVPDANAMTLATATHDGTPSARVVLLKGVDSRGFVFYTDYRSQKGQELSRNPRAALVLYWSPLERQVRITGTVTPTSAEESAAYFNSRPLASRLSASASLQSAPIANRSVLEARVANLARRHGETAPPPRPATWGGFRVTPTAIEFWQGRPNRLHDRLRYTLSQPGLWVIERLSP